MNLFDTEDCNDSGSTLHVVDHQADHRAVLSGVGLLAASILAGSPVGAAADGDAELIRLGALLDAAWAEQAAREAAGDFTEELYHCSRGIVAEIEQCSATTLAGLLVKTRACSWCHCGEPFGPESFSEHPTTDVRLAASVLRDLLTIGGKPVPYVARDQT